MRHVAIERSDAQEARLSERLARTDSATLDEWIADLLDAELSSDPQERLESLLLEGLVSDEVGGPVDDLFGGIRNEVGLTG